MDKKYYIAINGEKFEVSKEVYNIYYRSREKERYFMKTNKRDNIKVEEENIIFKNSLEVSLEKLENLGIEIKSDFNFEEIVLLSIDKDILVNTLNVLSPEEYKIIIDIFYNCKSEREIARELNCEFYKIHSKKLKILKKLKEILNNYKI